MTSLTGYEKLRNLESMVVGCELIRSKILKVVRPLNDAQEAAINGLVIESRNLYAEASGEVRTSELTNEKFAEYIHLLAQVRDQLAYFYLMKAKKEHLRGEDRTLREKIETAIITDRPIVPDVPTDDHTSPRSWPIEAAELGKRTDPPEVTEPGMYQLLDQIYRVRLTRDRKRCYAERFIPATITTPAQFKYDTGAIYKLKPEHRIERMPS